MKKFLKVTYPLFCVIIPFMIYISMDCETIVLPIVIACAMVGQIMDLYDNMITGLLSIIAVLSFGIGLLLFPIYYSYILFGWSYLILPGWLLLTFLIWCITKTLIKSGKYFSGIIMARKIYVLCLVIMTILFIIPGLYSLIDVQGNKHHFSTNENIIGVLGSGGWILLIGVEIYKSTRRVYLFSNYYKPYYILFLRRFIKDDYPQVQKCLEDLIHNKAGYTVMKIGAPHSLLSHSDMYDTVYLSSTDWQPYLRNHIQCAKLVLSVIDTSEGVIWEMIENTEYLTKYIYCILDWGIVDEVRKKLKYQSSLDSVLNHKFQNLLGLLQEQEIEDMVLFTFENSKAVYTTNMDAIIDYKLTSKWCKELQKMNL